MHRKERYTLLVIGGSAGALLTALDIISALKPSSALSVVVVLHRKQTQEDTLVDLLTARTLYRVKEVDDKDELEPGCIYVAPADYHVLLEKDSTLSLDDSEKVNFSRPSIDVTFESAAEAMGSKLMCVLLSGANADGVAGLIAAKRKGAFIVVQDPAASEFPVMPQQAISQVTVDMLLNPRNLPVLIDLLS
ncbi:MAG TPA: chemotaxis protein CheB [Chryseolinea sp.]|nr:chemotaxis protein CheB [Chryseolinea sp.]